MFTKRFSGILYINAVAALTVKVATITMYYRRKEEIAKCRSSASEHRALCFYEDSFLSSIITELFSVIIASLAVVGKSKSKILLFPVRSAQMALAIMTAFLRASQSGNIPTAKVLRKTQMMETTTQPRKNGSEKT